MGSSIREGRSEIQSLIKESPSLKRQMKKLIDEAYELAIGTAAVETKLPLETFSEKCPWSKEELMGMYG